MNKHSIVGRFITELKRRDVIKTCVAYLGVSWVVLQVLDVASQMLIVDVIVGTFTFIFLLCLFPVVLYISWHFHFTGNGWERTATADYDDKGNVIPPAPLGWGSWTGLSITVALCIVIGYQYFHQVKTRLAQEEEGIVQTVKADSIAVLPFEDQSPDKDQAFLAIGLAEELTSLLGQTDGFRVAASRSSQVLTEKGLAPVDIGRRLKVQTVLTGSVVNIGNRVKVRVELLNTENGHTVWTDTFLRELKDIFDLQAEIGRSLVNTLQDKYLESGTLRSLSATSSTDAYVVYLKAREQYRVQTTEGFKQARKLFEQAIALDPEYAQAYVGLADTIALLGDGKTQYGVLDNEVAATLSQGYVEKAILREPLMPRAFAVLGYIKMLRNQLEDAISAFDKAIELNPSLAIAYMWKYGALSDLQRIDESVESLEKAHELDPLFTSATYNLGFEYAKRGQYEQAKTIYQELQKDYPKFPKSYEGLADIHFNEGDFASAFAQAFQAHQLSPEESELKHKVISILFQLNLTDLVEDLTQDPATKPTIMLQNGEYEKLFKEMDFAVAAYPEDYWVAFEAGWYQGLVGDKIKASELITQNESELAKEDKFYMPLCSPAIEIAWAYQQLNKPELAKPIIDRCDEIRQQQLDSGVDYHELHHLAARIEVLRKNNEKALKDLSSAVTNGWREWWTAKDPLLEPIKDFPAFTQLMKTIENDLASQRKEAEIYYRSYKSD